MYQERGGNVWTKDQKVTTRNQRLKLENEWELCGLLRETARDGGSGEKGEKVFSKKRETIDEVAFTESRKEVERMLWLTHFDMLCETLAAVI